MELNDSRRKSIRFIINEVTLLRLENKFAPKLEFFTQIDFEYTDRFLHS